jgi:hypothetical protein
MYGRIPAFAGLPWEERRLTTRMHTKSQSARGVWTAGDDGTFEFPSIVGAPLLLVLEHEGFAPILLEQPAMAPGQDVSLGDLSFEEGITLAGRVVDEEGRPIGGASVDVAELWGPDEPVLTDATGQFSLPHMPRHVLRLRVRADGSPMHLFSVDAAAAHPADVYRVGPGTPLRGGVFLPSGAPAPDAWVFVRPADLAPFLGAQERTTYNAECDVSGRFSLVLPPGRYDISATAGDEYVLTVPMGFSMRGGLRAEHGVVHPAEGDVRLVVR